MQSNNLLHSKTDYVSAIKKLFPIGIYWGTQFDNPQSDISLWVEAKSEELYRFKSRFSELITESAPKTADFTLDNWERVLLGAISPHLPKQLRQNLLLTKRRGCVNQGVLQEIARLYTVKIKRIYFPYRSAFFGFTRIGIHRMSSPAAFSVLFLDCELQDTSLMFDFEQAIKEVLSANTISYFFYK